MPTRHLKVSGKNIALQLSAEVLGRMGGDVFREPSLSLGADFAFPGLGWEPGARELLHEREENLKGSLDQITGCHSEPGAFILERIGSGRMSLPPTKEEKNR
ncbi:hypothetical protein CEXT_292571 [Caerostris extrusa]|uniref:Uncharacterized protein n=1 Tax=Caerostris extrusa TaxID=172846 RepID=A0AAV4W8G7_CAEEX|nr:hypothetical protein CEXT_292571 [Caerostris extrusa]